MCDVCIHSFTLYFSYVLTKSVAIESIEATLLKNKEKTWTGLDILSSYMVMMATGLHQIETSLL